MNADIGNAAGTIWAFLDKQSEPLAVTTLKKEIDLSSTLLMMGLGWLAREDKLDFDVAKNSCKISLKR